MIDGMLGPEQISPGRFTDSRILDLQKRISVEIAPEFEKEFPERVISEVIISAGDKTYSSGPREARWEASDPPTDHELEDKFVALCEPVYGKEECKRLVESFWKLDKSRTCRDLFQKNTTYNNQK